MPRLIHHAERDHDEDQSSRGSSFLARSVSSSASSANRRLRRLRPEEHHDEERPSMNVGIGNKSTVTPLPRLQNAGSDFVVPSTAVLDYLMNNQATDSTIHELRQFDPSWLQEQAMLFEQQNAYHAPHRPYVPQPMQTIATIQMDATTNNYSAPHSLREPAPLHTVTTTLTMREQQQQQHRVDSPHRSQHGGGLPSVSALKKRRVDGALQSRVVNTTTADPAAWSVLKELQAVQYGSASGGFEGEEVVDDRITPHRRQYNQLQQQQHIMASENVLPVVTPHLQRVLPTCLVEQNGETTLRELQQVMGLAGPSSAGRQSSSAKRSTTRPFNASTFDGVDSDSRGWWATTSSAPMPTYAEDPNFSLELF